MWRVVTNGKKFRVMNEKGEFALEQRQDWAFPRTWNTYQEAESWCSERNWITATPPQNEEAPE
jgi:hypothetical protein